MVWPGDGDGAGRGSPPLGHPLARDRDEELVERARSGDRQAFRQLFLAHRSQVARVIQRLVPVNEIEDVVQEVFLHVHRSLGSFRGDARFSTWLFRLSLNVARMHVRRAKSRPKLSLAGDTADVRLERSHVDTPASESERHERIVALDKLLAQLSEKKREALVLHDFEGLSADEISKVVEAPVMTVRTRVFYARRELYAAMAADPALAGLSRWLSPQSKGGVPGGLGATPPANDQRGDEEGDE
jgi:RNA polymerase sigma-70 factor (ECF subfamily)